MVQYEINGVAVSMSPPRSSITWHGAGLGMSFTSLNVGLLRSSLETPPSGPTAHVRAFGPGAIGHQAHPHSTSAVVAGTTPLLLALQQNVEAPFFDPNNKDSFAKFAKDWASWSKWQLVGRPLGHLGDMMQRDLLLIRLHPILKEKYTEDGLRRPTTTIQEVWQDLVRTFSVDNSQFWRQK